MLVSADGRQLLTAGDDSTRLWDVATGTEIMKVAGLTTAAFSPNGKFVLTGGIEQFDSLGRRNGPDTYGEGVERGHR